MGEGERGERSILTDRSRFTVCFICTDFLQDGAGGGGAELEDGTKSTLVAVPGPPCNDVRLGQAAQPQNGIWGGGAGDYKQAKCLY